MLLGYSYPLLAEGTIRLANFNALCFEIGVSLISNPNVSGLDNSANASNFAKLVLSKPHYDQQTSVADDL
jgi:hypothetical protein